MLSSAITFLIIYQEIDNTLSSQQFTSAANADSNAQNQFQDAFTALKLRILLLMTGGLAIIAISGFVWARTASRRINRPIRSIARAVSRLAAGQLNETVHIDSTDEFGQISNNINELAANLQELLLYIWKQTGECISLLEEVDTGGPDAHQAGNPHGDATQAIEKLTEAVNNLREMAQAYVFYDVRLDGEQALAINEPGQPASED